MPAFLIHGFIGYLFFGKKGFYFGILPDLIGFSYYFLRLFINYKPEYLSLDIREIIHPNKMNEIDHFLYDISHSLILWFIILLLFKKKYIYSAIFSIILDIFLHSEHTDTFTNGWIGPSFLYPFNHYYFDGISWSSKIGIYIICLILIILLLLSPQQKNNIIQYLP